MTDGTRAPGRPAYSRRFWRAKYAKHWDVLVAEWGTPQELDLMTAFHVGRNTLWRARRRYGFAIGSTGPDPELEHGGDG